MPAAVGASMSKLCESRPMLITLNVTDPHGPAAGESRKLYSVILTLTVVWAGSVHVPPTPGTGVGATVGFTTAPGAAAAAFVATLKTPFIPRLACPSTDELKG